MFREMRRGPQSLTKEEITQVLTRETRGVLSVNGDDGYPYGIPMNHFYDEEAGVLFFHGSKIGHRVDAVRNNPKVSYCVYGQDTQKDGDWAKYVRSVVAFGQVEFVEKPEEVIAWIRKLCAKFPCPDEYVEQEIREDAEKTLCFIIRIEHISGKLVHEA